MFNYQRQKNFAILVTLLAVFLANYAEIASYTFSLIFLDDTQGALKLVSFYYTFINIFRGFFLVQFVLACSAIQVRFKALNDEFTRKHSTIRKLFFPKPNITTNFYLGKTFQQLCDCIDIVNETLTINFIPMFAVFLVRFKVFIFQNQTAITLNY